MSKRQILNLYKKLLTQVNTTFHEDPAVLKNALKRTRDTFKENKLISKDNVHKEIENANGVLYLLKNHIAKGKEVRPNEYHLDIKPQMLEKSK